MTAWTDALRGRSRPGHDATRFGRDVSDRGNEVGYAGPADGDFARYVDQLLSNAESQRRAQTRAPTPVHDARVPKASAASQQTDLRRKPAQAALKPGADSLARLRAQAEDAASKPAVKVGMKLLPLLIWLPVVVALFFWQGAAISLVGMVLVAGLVISFVRKLLGGKKG